MRTDGTVYRFGPFELDPGRRLMRRGADTVSLPDRQMDVLLLLVAHAGETVPKDALIEGAWREVAVGDNSLAQAIAGLRKTLGGEHSGEPRIETMVGHGYRFVAPVERVHPPVALATVYAVLDPQRVVINGRAALETLDRCQVIRAREMFEEAVRVAPRLADAHIGLANACALAFESTRIDAAPDVAALHVADRHAHEACRLDPGSADAWATLAFVLDRNGHRRDALAAARTAVTLEPDGWRHHLRLASVSWGDERLRAARRVTTLCAGVPFAHWFMATVFVARQSFQTALDVLRTGCATQDAQRPETDRFHFVGLHLLHGLVLAAQGDEEMALDELTRELSATSEHHVYGRECRANSCYAIGAIQWRRGGRDDAVAAFEEAVTQVPGHAPASAALAALSHRLPAPCAPGTAGTVDAAIVHAVACVTEGKPHDAARLCGAALTQAPPGSDGWLLPVEPLLHPTAQPEAWAPTLTMLRERAL